MINQLKSIIGFKEEEIELPEEVEVEELPEKESKDVDSEFLKTRIDDLELSVRTTNSLEGANIRTVGGLVRKREEDILSIEGIGQKGLQEIKRALSNFGVTLK